MKPTTSPVQLVPALNAIIRSPANTTSPNTDETPLMNRSEASQPRDTLNGLITSVRMKAKRAKKSPPMKPNLGLPPLWDKADGSLPVTTDRPHGDIDYYDKEPQSDHDPCPVQIGTTQVCIPDVGLMRRQVEQYGSESQGASQGQRNPRAACQSINTSQESSFKHQPKAFRHLNRLLKPMTVCIAAVCQMGNPAYYPWIVYCADRQVTTFVKYESGQAKIKLMTQKGDCLGMLSANDSLTADLILENAREGLKGEPQPPVRKVVETVSQSCKDIKDGRTRSEILDRYSLVVKSLNATPDSVVKDAMTRVNNYYYELECQFIIAGFDDEGRTPHIYMIDEEGKSDLYDSAAFVTIGSGGPLAFLELTKYGHNNQDTAPVTIPRVWMAKRISERAEGVGRTADLGAIYYGKHPQVEGIVPLITNLSPPEFTGEFDAALEDIRKFENDKHLELYKKFFGKMQGKPTGDEAKSS